MNSKLLKLTEEEFQGIQEEMQGIPCKAAVGSLMYAMVSDLEFSVSMVSQFMSRAGPSHWMVMKRITRYLKGTLDLKLCLRGKDVSLKGYCDVDKGGDANERRSTTGLLGLEERLRGIRAITST